MVLDRIVPSACARLGLCAHPSLFRMSNHKPCRVPFLRTGNSARSILAEYLLNEQAKGRFEAFSAGALPSGKVNPYAVETLREHYGIDAASARIKSWEEFSAQPFDFIITLCDKARESCPVSPWPSDHGALGFARSRGFRRNTRQDPQWVPECRQPNRLPHQSVHGPSR